MISEHSFTSIFGAVSADPDTEDSLVHVARAAIDAGYAIVPNRPGTKQPMCTLNATERKRADAAAQSAAQASGRRRWDTVRHDCGVHEAITDRKVSDRVLKRLTRDFGRINLGIELRQSRLVVVDVDTEDEKAAFEATWRAETGAEPPGLTIASPGVQAADGTWVHSGGGHYYFTIPEHAPLLPPEPGALKDETGFSIMWANRQVLVPPSVRPEGSYRLVGTPTEIPRWLMRRVVDAVLDYRNRKEEQEERRRIRLATAVGDTAAIDEWSAEVSWAELLVPDGWVETGMNESCGCPTFTAPGAHASPKSAVAHEIGCNNPNYDLSAGHGPMHIWTDNPPEALINLPSSSSGKTCSKIQYYALTRHGGTDGAALAQACRDLGIRREGGSVAALTGLVSGSGPSPLPVPTQRDEVPVPPPSPDPERHPVPPQPAVPPTPPAPPVVGQDGGPPPPFEQAGPGSGAPPAPESPLLAGIRALMEGLPEEMDQRARDEVARKLEDGFLRHQSQRLLESVLGDELAALEKIRIRRHSDLKDEVAQEKAAARAAENPLVPLPFDQFLERPSPEPLVPGFIYQDSVFRVWGPPGEGKSFLVLSWLVHVALGRPWSRNVPVARKKALYVFAEGGAVNRDRAAALADRLGASTAELSQWMHFLEDSSIVLHPDSIEPVLELVRAGEYGLVVFDTQARYTAGMNENTPEMSLMVKALDAIKETGCTVGVVHHTGHDEKERPRGWGGVTAAMDTEIRVHMPEKGVKDVRVWVSRDKAADATTVEREFALTAHGPAAVLVEKTVSLNPEVRRAEPTPQQRSLLPAEILSYRGAGSKLIAEMAMAFAETEVNGERPVYTRAQVAKLLGRSSADGSVVNAWTALKGLNAIVPIQGAGPTGAHQWSDEKLWSAPEDDPPPAAARPGPITPLQVD